MTQHLFNGETTSDKAQLDANFTELYSAVAVVAPITNTSGHLGFGGAALTNYTSTFYGGSALHCAGTGDNAPNSSKGFWVTKDGGTSYSGFVWQLNASYGADFYIGNGSSAWNKALSCDVSSAWTPGGDNAQAWGSGAKRWSVIYAGTGSINTSDAREKTDVTALSAAEISAAQELVSNIGIYQWLSAIQSKGQGDARKHIGMTVQAAMSIMTSHGLDPMAYGFICYDAWPEEKDADGNVTLAAGDRYGFRTDELGMFIARGVAASLATIQARLTAAGIA